VPIDPLSGEVLLPDLQMSIFSLCSQDGRGWAGRGGGRLSCLVFLLYKDTNSIHEGSYFRTKSPPKGSLYKHYHTGVRFLQMNAGGT
jgi:hypothetical protein